jgi:hypothetical protein
MILKNTKKHTTGMTTQATTAAIMVVARKCMIDE